MSNLFLLLSFSKKEREKKKREKERPNSSDKVRQDREGGTALLGLHKQVYHTGSGNLLSFIQ